MLCKQHTQPLHACAVLTIPARRGMHMSLPCACLGAAPPLPQLHAQHKHRHHTTLHTSPINTQRPLSSSPSPILAHRNIPLLYKALQQARPRYNIFCRPSHCACVSRCRSKQSTATVLSVLQLQAGYRSAASHHALHQPQCWRAMSAADHGAMVPAHNSPTPTPIPLSLHSKAQPSLKPCYRGMRDTILAAAHQPQCW